LTRPISTKLVRFGTNLYVDPSSLDLFWFDESARCVHLVFKRGATATVEHAHATELRGLLTESDGAADGVPLSGAAVESGVLGGEGLFPNLEQLLSSGNKKAWFHKTDDGKNVFLACANVGGSCSVRIFDAHSGVALSKHYGNGNFREFFSDLIEGATPVTVDSQPNLARDCKRRLPERIFDQLRQQIDRTE
jgi:hypothetical protein